MNYRSLYKVNNILNRADVNREELTTYRNNKRLENFNRNRNCYEVENEDKKNTEDKTNRKDLLLQWREKKKMMKNMIDKKKKPFVVGIKHHNVGSPLFTDISNKLLIKQTAGKSKLATTSKKETNNRTPVKQLPFGPVPSNQRFKFTVHPSVKKLTIPQSPSFLSAKKKKIDENKETVKKLNTKANVPKTIPKKATIIKRPKINIIRSKPVTGVKKNNAEKLKRTPKDTRYRAKVLADKSNVNSTSKAKNDSIEALVLPATPTHESTPENKEVEFVISPFVTIARGKERHSAKRPTDSAKRSQQKISLNTTFDAEDADTKSEGAIFYKRLDDEARQLIEKCDCWTKLALTHLPKEIEEEIDSVVGQSRLLVSDKFEQFRSLITRFETRSEPPVILDDLNGFWDMMYIQVEKMNERLQKLKTLKENNWKMSPVESKIQKHTKKMLKKPKPQNKPKGNFREFLKGLKTRANPDCPIAGSEISTDVNSAPSTSSYFTSASPGVANRSASQSLLKKVLSTSVTERRRSSLVSGLLALRSSFSGKELGTSPLALVDDTMNCSSKSILKKDNLDRKIKSMKKVAFGETTHNNSDLNSTFTLDVSEQENAYNTNELLEQQADCMDSISAALQELQPKITFIASTPNKNKHENDSFATPEQLIKRRVQTPGAHVTPRRSIRILSKLEPVASELTPRRSLRLKPKQNSLM